MRKNNYKKTGAAFILITMFLISTSIGTIAGVTDRNLSSDEKVQNQPFADKKPDSYLSDPSPNHDELVLKTKEIQIPQNNLTYYQDKYAVIIIGDPDDPQHYKWYTNDAQRQYNLLKNKYDFLPGNIFVLLTLKYGNEWEDNLSCNPDIVDMEASEKNIKNLFKEFRTNGLYEVDNKDLLYVVFIGHGLDIGTLYGNISRGIDLWPNGHDTYFGLEAETGEEIVQTCEELELIKNEAAQYLPAKAIGEFVDSKVSSINFNSNCTILSPTKLFDWEFGLYTSNIKAKRMIFMLQPCFSGGFIRELSGKNRVILTASKENQLANAPFIGYVYHGLNGSADLNSDNKITIAEVFEYTSIKVREYLQNHPEDRPQQPLIDDNGDGIGKLDQNTGYNPEKEGYDGYITDRIYNLNCEESNLSTVLTSQQIKTQELAIIEENTISDS